MVGTGMPPQQARNELYDLIRNEIPFEEKANGVLDLGKRYLNADNGHLTRIDTETGHWEAILSTDPADGRFPPGLELDLGTTYCRRTIDADSPITLHDASIQGWSDDPAFETHELHCYLGTTLVLDGDPFGTVCFVAEDPRRSQFSNEETMFAELLTRLLERELEQKRYEAQLTRQSNLALVLNRVLRHNLRNSMTIIRGNTQLIADTLEDHSAVENSLNQIDKLLALSKKARELDRIVTAENERKSTEIVSLIEDIAGDVCAEFPAASISIESDEEVTATVLPSFGRALLELLENAAKHGGEAPTVTVRVTTIPNDIQISIEDNGPGLADHEAEVLKTGTETPLTHGTGLGLWLAHWIVTSHGGSIKATVTEMGTTMTVSIPRKPATNVQRELTKLSRGRDKYRAAFEDAPAAMVIIDDDAQILDANTMATGIYGATEERLLGRAIPEFLPDEFDFEPKWRDFQESGSKRGSVRILGADGEERLVEYSAMADIVPGQHLVISRKLTDQEVSEMNG